MRPSRVVPPYRNDVPADLHPDVLRRAYREMLRIRRVEEEIERRYAADQMKTPIHLSIGQEAIAVGVCAVLDRSDLVFTSHRSHAPYLAKGGDLRAMISELHCRANGCAGSRGGSMHLIDPAVGLVGGSAICGGAVPLAVGAALSAQVLGRGHVSVVFFGDGASEEGVVWESINFAAVRKLPVLFVCENNFYSVCSPLTHRQAGLEIHRKAEAFGAASRLVNGIDFAEVWSATRDLVERMRDGGGPAFLEARAYRWRGHGGAGDDAKLGYRAEDELREWRAHCPVGTLAKYLESRGIGDVDECAIEKEIAEAFAHALNSPLPDATGVLEHVYSS